MANICEYKVIVKGKKNACYAFFGSMSCAGNKEIVGEEAFDGGIWKVRFEGDCNWAVNAYCEPWTGDFPVVLPEDPQEAMDEAEDKYWYITVAERSKMFEVEVWCNSLDIDDPSNGPNFDHYINGKIDFSDDCPPSIEFGENEWFWDECEEDEESEGCDECEEDE